MIRQRELLRAGLEMPATKILIIDAARSFDSARKEEVQRREITASQYQNDESNLRRYILPYKANRTLQFTKTPEWKELFEHVMAKHELAPATYNRIRSTAQALYSWAIKQGLVMVNPITAVPKKSEKVKKRQYIVWETKKECQAYLGKAHTEGQGFDMAAHIFANTGAREAEVAAIRICDVELDHETRNGTIRLARIFDTRGSKKFEPRTKAGEGEERHVPITVELFDKIVAHLASTKWSRPEDLLVCHDDGTMIHPRRMLEMHYRVCERAGVSRIPVHKIRHFFATYQRDQGIKESDLKEQLGHSSELVTKTYGKKTKFAAKQRVLKGIGAPTVSADNVVAIGGQRK